MQSFGSAPIYKMLKDYTGCGTFDCRLNFVNGIKKYAKGMRNVWSVEI